MTIPNHFTCTLGQAALLNKETTIISSIDAFMQQKAQRVPELPAVAFPRPAPSTNVWSCQVYTFRDIHRGVSHTANFLLQQGAFENRPQQTVALLSPSTPEFLFTWLALIRLGHAVLLIAPQCRPTAILHLCKACNVELLMYDSIYEKQAEEVEIVAREESSTNHPKLSCFQLELDNESDDFSNALRQPAIEVSGKHVSSSSVAYLHHTSGTSTGVPKPIPQTHMAAIGVLPQTLKGAGEGVFTTTPLYHGGIADLFRAWTSSAMIGLFPGKDVPITARHVVNCFEALKLCNITPRIVYFSSVPYVLQMLASDETGLGYLQRMQIVGVGGAALPAEVGDELARQKVNLISRFGSAECGFLLSSHRDYADDRDWQYLRSSSGTEHLRFEQQDDETSELVVLNGWPHRAKTNRPDESYATSDLFIPHPSIPNAWRYHSRADSQLTLITGKKFDPAPLESSIAASRFLDDVFIFGNGQPYPGALLFRSEQAKEMSDEDLIAMLALSIEKLNRESQDHARIARNMLVIIPYGENKLEKSSKGTLLRNKAEETYSEKIKEAYTSTNNHISRDTPDGDIPKVLIDRIRFILGKADELHPVTDLFSYGVDSVASIQIRHMLLQLVPGNPTPLPLNIVEDCGTIERLAQFVTSKRHGGDYINEEDDSRLMLDLVEEYGAFESNTYDGGPEGHVQSAPATRADKVVLLTGATGSLGAHLLDQYCLDPTVSQIYLLVRGADDRATHSRVAKSLSYRGLPNHLDPKPHDAQRVYPEITILRCQLSARNLGLSPNAYDTLEQSTTHIIHAAWSVNFRMRLRSFAKDDIGGLRNLLLLTLGGKQQPRFAFISSVAAVARTKQGAASGASRTIAETLSTDPNDASPLGYGRSKWVAEQLCARAQDSISTQGDDARFSILRVGQLSGASDSGVWNAMEAWPLMLASSKATGCLPQLGDREKLRWLAVDVAAKAVAQISLRSHHREETGGDWERQARVAVYHILNAAEPASTWRHLTQWMEKVSPGLDVLSPMEWLDRMESLQREKPEHPALKLMGLWKAAYGMDRGESGGKAVNGEDGAGEVLFGTMKAQETAPVLKNVMPVEEQYFSKMWQWIEENM